MENVLIIQECKNIKISSIIWCCNITADSHDDNPGTKVNRKSSYWRKSYRLLIINIRIYHFIASLQEHPKLYKMHEDNTLISAMLYIIFKFCLLCLWIFFKWGLVVKTIYQCGPRADIPRQELVFTSLSFSLLSFLSFYFSNILKQHIPLKYISFS